MRYLSLTLAVAACGLFAGTWPGNIRQLDNALRLACAMAGEQATIGPEHLPDELLDCGL